MVSTSSDHHHFSPEYYHNLLPLFTNNFLLFRQVDVMSPLLNSEQVISDLYNLAFFLTPRHSLGDPFFLFYMLKLSSRHNEQVLVPKII